MLLKREKRRRMYMANIIMTSAVRPRNGAIIPVCARCQCKYPINQFVKGTTFQ